VSTPPVYALMLRLLDDFLYVSTEQSVTETFIDSLAKEDEKTYKVQINKEKTKTSYTGKGMVEINGVSFLPWCGYMINTNTFEFQIDYEKLAGTSMLDTLSNKYDGKPIQNLYLQLLRPVRSKCSHILLDFNVNSLDVIHLNIYQLFLFVGIKLITAVKTIRKITSNPTNEMAILKLIESLIAGVWKIIKRCKIDPSPVPNIDFICPLEENQVQWLGFSGFLQIFKKKQTSFRLVVESLEVILKDRKFKTLKSKLISATNPKKSQALLNRMDY
jgi:hypothetical protein